MYEQYEEAKEAFVLHARYDEEDGGELEWSGGTLSFFLINFCAATSNANPNRTSDPPEQRMGRPRPIHHPPKQ